MKFGLRLTIFLIIFSPTIALPSISNAQIPASIDGIQIDTTPTVPSPGQKVTVSIESYSTDLNGASIVWLVDGKNFAQGVGKKSVQVVAPALGKTTTVLAAIKTVEGKEIKKSITIKSGSVDLVWESEGFVPPLYKGKAHFAYENTLRISAIPHVAGPNGEIDPKTLLYKWMVNDQVIQDQSGYGKQTLTYQTEVPRQLDVYVEVATANGSNKATNQITLSPGNPSISFYEEDPLYGVLYNKAILNTIQLTKPELNIRAVPYTFTVFKDRPMTFNWSINNLERSDLSTNESITLRTKGDSDGQSSISLSIRNAENILQGAEGGFNVLFKKKAAAVNSSLFQ